MNFNKYSIDENGVGTPVNPYDKYEVNTPNDWDRFEFYKISNTIQTVGVVPGAYPVEAFKRDHFRFWDGSKWYKISDEEFFSDDYSRYEPFNKFESIVGSVYTLKEETPTDNKESVDVTGVEEAKRQILYTLVFKNPTDGSILKSGEYSALQLLEKTEEDIRDHVCICDCQPTGESSYVECNCQDYYDDFEFSHIEQSTQSNSELTRLKALVEKYEKALREIADCNSHGYAGKVTMKGIATNTLKK